MGGFDCFIFTSLEASNLCFIHLSYCLNDNKICVNIFVVFNINTLCMITISNLLLHIRYNILTNEVN